MKEVLLFGHKKPDTDSCVSAIALSYLKNQLGEKTSPRVLGRVNNETKYVLDCFHVPVPKYLNDVKLQICDINYVHNCYMNEYASIYDCYRYLEKNKINSIPIVDSSKKIKGIITNNSILKELIERKYNHINTSYENIIKTIDGKEVLKQDNEIKGEVISTAYRSTTFVDEIILKEDSILIVGNRHSIIEYAVKNKIKMIILVSSAKMKEEHLQLARENKINVIETALNSLEVIQYIALSNYVKNIVEKREDVYIYNTDYYKDFLDKHTKIKSDGYPVINKNRDCLGFLTINNLYDKKKKQVILVDHNEKIQSVDGIDEAEILEVVDHHKLGDFSTNYPINITTMPVGSTATIIYHLFVDNKIEIPKHIAGIMMGAILSDTLLFKSPTTTTMDRYAVSQLERICNLDYRQFGLEMIKQGSSLEGKTKEEILYSDFKGFMVDDKKVGIGQIYTMDYSKISAVAEEYVHLLNDISKNENYYILALFVTDVINNGSYILFNDHAKIELERSFSLENIKQEYFLENVISRKKQIIPKIMETLEKR